jgi:succinate dehydrogenase flavin-adding protein (antitoxin of CptAB toxin-antitoxin module)
MKELDVLLARWLDLRWACADIRRQRAFRQLLEQADPQIADWLIGGSRPDDPELAALIDDIVCTRH